MLPGSNQPRQPCDLQCDYRVITKTHLHILRYHGPHCTKCSVLQSSLVVHGFRFLLGIKLYLVIVLMGYVP